VLVNGNKAFNNASYTSGIVFWVFLTGDMKINKNRFWSPGLTHKALSQRL
jgi:hypothetical protein